MYNVRQTNTTNLLCFKLFKQVFYIYIKVYKEIASNWQYKFDQILLHQIFIEKNYMKKNSLRCKNALKSENTDRETMKTMKLIFLRATAISFLVIEQ